MVHRVPGQPELKKTKKTKQQKKDFNYFVNKECQIPLKSIKKY